MAVFLMEGSIGMIATPRLTARDND